MIRPATIRRGRCGNCVTTKSGLVDDIARLGAITTEIREAPTFYYAEDYHQQYLAKNPDGYCPNHSCGIPYRSEVSYAGARA